MIDHRTQYATPKAEKLSESAKKPARKINPVRVRSPGYGETRTSSLRESTERNAVRTNVGPRATGADMIERARSTMHPAEFAVFVKRLTAAVPR